MENTNNVKLGAADSGPMKPKVSLQDVALLFFVLVLIAFVGGLGAASLLSAAAAVAAWLSLRFVVSRSFVPRLVYSSIWAVVAIVAAFAVVVLWSKATGYSDPDFEVHIEFWPAVAIGLAVYVAAAVLIALAIAVMDAVLQMLTRKPEAGERPM